MFLNVLETVRIIVLYFLVKNLPRVVWTVLCLLLIQKNRASRINIFSVPCKLSYSFLLNLDQLPTFYPFALCVVKYPSVSSVQSLSRVRLFATPWIPARQASLSITNSRSSLRLSSIESVMASSHLILCHPLLLLPSIFPSTRVFSNASALRIGWPKY